MPISHITSEETAENIRRIFTDRVGKIRASTSELCGFVDSPAKTAKMFGFNLEDDRIYSDDEWYDLCDVIFYVRDMTELFRRTTGLLSGCNSDAALMLSFYEIRLLANMLRSPKVALMVLAYIYNGAINHELMAMSYLTEIGKCVTGTVDCKANAFADAAYLLGNHAAKLLGRKMPDPLEGQSQQSHRWASVEEIRQYEDRMHEKFLNITHSALENLVGVSGLKEGGRVFIFKSNDLPEFLWGKNGTILGKDGDDSYWITLAHPGPQGETEWLIDYHYFRTL